jgi:hypothetical protein
METILYSITPRECIHVSLKGSASFSIYVQNTTGNVTIFNKGRTREYTREIIEGEIQPSCRIKNDKQAREYNEKHMTTQSLQQATKQHSTHTNWTSRQSDLESCPSNY